MPLVQIETHINADLQTCFDLARDINFYQNSLKKSNEIAVDGKITGLVEANDSITWEVKHLGIVRHITLKITEFKSPNLFVDEMIKGDYKSYKHEHIFCESGNYTKMMDRFFFESPYGIIGKLIDSIFLKKYMINILKARNRTLKVTAEKMQLIGVSQ